MNKQSFVLFTLSLLIFCSSVLAQSTAFTYQGSLALSGQPANGSFDFEFALFDSAAAGNQLGSTQAVNNVAVSNGNFTVNLDFGSQFPGAGRFLEIRVRQAGQPGLTTLSPRQPISSAPYSVRSLAAETAETAATATNATNATNAVNATNATTAATATNALSLGGVAASQYVVTTDGRLSDARPPTPGSPNYIQNSVTTQPSSNFNITGNGTVGGTLSGNVVDAATQFRIGGSHILSANGTSNIFAGVNSGQVTTGGNNAFFGAQSGAANTSGATNSFFGGNAGLGNTTGSGNAFFGNGAGFANTTGGLNALFGINAGSNQTTSTGNSFFGGAAGSNTTTGFFNTFSGFFTGQTNTTGTENTLYGSNSNVLSAGLNNATAIGSRAAVSQNNSLVLGSINGVNSATASTNVGIGTTAPTERLHVVGNGLFTGNLTVSGTINGTGGGVTGLNASNITGGTLANERLGQIPTANIADGAVTDAKIVSVSGAKVTGTVANATDAVNATNAVNATDATNAATATNALNLGGVAADQYVQTGDARLSDERSPLPGSANYIQNATTQQASSDFNISGNGTAGGTLSGNVVNASASYNLAGTTIIKGNNGSGARLFIGALAGNLTTTGRSNVFVGHNAGTDIQDGNNNSIFGINAGPNLTSGSNNSFFGRDAGFNARSGSSNTFIGFGSDFSFTLASGDRNTLIGTNTTVNTGLNNATAIGANAIVRQSNSLVLGSIAGLNSATDDTNVGIGITAPTERLHVVGNGRFTGNVTVNANVGIGTTAPSERLDIATNGGSMLFGGAGCPSGSVGIGLNGAFGSCTNYSVRGDGQSVFINRPTGGLVVFRENNGSSQVLIHPGGSLEVRVLGTSGGTALCRNASSIIAFCSSSLRYKQNIVPYAPGMSFIRQLRPIAYEWKADGMKDVGFGAEDVAKIDPRFVTYNDKGEVEGIKYDRMSAAFVNAFREQETEISTQRAEIESLKKQVDQQKAQIAELRALICAVAGNAAACAVSK